MRLTTFKCSEDEYSLVVLKGIVVGEGVVVVGGETLVVVVVGEGERVVVIVVGMAEVVAMVEGEV
jgi:hypothetical protein